MEDCPHNNLVVVGELAGRILALVKLEMVENCVMIIMPNFNIILFTPYTLTTVGKVLRCLLVIHWLLNPKDWLCRYKVE